MFAHRIDSPPSPAAVHVTPSKFGDNPVRPFLISFSMAREIAPSYCWRPRLLSQAPTSMIRSYVQDGDKSPRSKCKSRQDAPRWAAFGLIPAQSPILAGIKCRIRTIRPSGPRSGVPALSGRYLLCAIEQQNMRKDRLPVTSRAGIAADAPMHLLDFGTAELRYAGDDAVQLDNRPRLALSQTKPSS